MSIPVYSDVKINGNIQVTSNDKPSAGDIVQRTIKKDVNWANNHVLDRDLLFTVTMNSGSYELHLFTLSDVIIHIHTLVLESKEHSQYTNVFTYGKRFHWCKPLVITQEKSFTTVLSTWAEPTQCRVSIQATIYTPDQLTHINTNNVTVSSYKTSFSTPLYAEGFRTSMLSGMHSDEINSNNNIPYAVAFSSQVREYISEETGKKRIGLSYSNQNEFIKKFPDVVQQLKIPLTNTRVDKYVVDLEQLVYMLIQDVNALYTRIQTLEGT